MNEIGTIDRPLTAAEVRAQIQTIQEILKGSMKEGTHYGTIPGCPNPTLYKPGAELLLLAFRVAATPDVQDLSTADAFRYRVTVRAASMSGVHLGAGCGEASTDEDKFRWRLAVCPEEYEGTPEDRRRLKYGKDKKGEVYKVEQIRTNPADQANTALKIAVKRALVAVCLQIFAASDIFAQDLEDIDPALLQQNQNQNQNPPPAPRPRAGKPATKPPKAKKTTPGKITPAKARKIRARCAAAKIDPADLCKRLGAKAIESIPAGKLDAALEIISTWGTDEKAPGL